MPRPISSGSNEKINQLPTGINKAAITPIGPMTRQLICLWTPGMSCAVTMISIMITIATVSRGPNNNTNIGAINMPEPTPAKPRIRPAATLIVMAIANAVSKSG